MAAVELKTYILNYKHLLEAFISVKKVNSKYINEININYGWLGLNLYDSSKAFACLSRKKKRQ